MLSYDTIEFHTLELLKSLMLEPSFSAMRLVGGTALALQYGHRQSIDLDFFGDLKCEKSETKNILSQYGKVTVLKETETIRIYVIDGIKVDFVHYSCSVKSAFEQHHAQRVGQGTHKPRSLFCPLCR